jgi:multidrug resistance protein
MKAPDTDRDDALIRSSSSSLSSTEEGSQPPVPLPYDGQQDTPPMPPGTRTRTSSFHLAIHTLSSLRDTVSHSGHDVPLTRQSTGYSVKEIYGDMDDDDVRLRRSNTRSAILDTMVRRVQSIGEDRPSHAPQKDEESSASSGEPAAETEGFYENAPDDPVPTKDHGLEFSGVDPELVAWDGPDDPQYPRNWTWGAKVWQTALVACYTLISPMTSSIPSMAMPEIARTLGMEHSTFLKLFLVLVMVLAWAVGPLVIAPISESASVGRRLVLNILIWANFFFNLGCGLCHTPAQLCVFRFLGGLAGCAPLNVGAGTLADLYDDDERLVAMAFYSMCPTLGPVLSPVISGFIVSHIGWRWVFHVLSIFNFVVAVVGTLLFRETYSPRLLHDKAKRLRKETGNQYLHTIYEIADGETRWGKAALTVLRPVMLLFTNPMVFGLGSFMAFTYGFMYLMIVTFPTVYKVNYGFLTSITGLFYLPLGVGYVIGNVVLTWAIDHVYRKLTARNGGVAKPEYRLPCLCLLGVGIPIGLIWYGWLAQKQLHWIMPAIGCAIFAFLFIAVFLTIQSYLIDMNNRFAASSMAATAVFRSLFGFLFPLFATAMYDRLGYGWGNTMFAFIGLALGVPFPLFCLKYGEQLRNAANRRMDERQARRDERNLRRLQAMNEKH